MPQPYKSNPQHLLMLLLALVNSAFLSGVEGSLCANTHANLTYLVEHLASWRSIGVHVLTTTLDG